MSKKPKIIEKRSVEEIRVAQTEFNGKPLIDVRIYWKKSDTETIPTKKGVSLPIEKLNDLILAFERLRT